MHVTDELRMSLQEHPTEVPSSIPGPAEELSDWYILFHGEVYCSLTPKLWTKLAKLIKML